MAYTPPSFTDYVTALQAQRICLYNATSQQYDISGIDNQGYNWQVPMLKCDSRKCTQHNQNALPFCEYAIVGVSGSTPDDVGGHTRAVLFQQWMEATWPELAQVGQSFAKTNGLPSFSFVRLFASSDDMANYVTSQDYGIMGVPKLAMGIVWNGNASTDYTYSLRQNSTNFNAPEAEGRPASPTTPPTQVLFSSYAKNDFSVCTPQGGTATQGPLESSCTGQYLYNGILTFQRLVDDFILHDSGAANRGYSVAQSGVRFVQFPTPSYRQNGFYSSISGTLVESCLLLASLLVLFRSCDCHHHVSGLLHENRVRTLADYFGYVVSGGSNDFLHYTRKGIASKGINENDGRE